ncbi:MAG: cellulase family glycosylhydrolase [Planctomycetaceae bacterium]|jgi:hypothetical protein|nr:cellulase family glycosylhydrolase [Planctomycetaceae bacterium]
MQLTKREFLKTSVILGTSLAVPSFLNAQEAKETEKKTDITPQLKNTSFSWVRGFNYQPGYSSGSGGYEDGTGWSLWRDLKIDIIDRELSHGKELFPDMTAVRLWLPYNVYLVQPKQFLEDFSKFIDIVGKLKLRAMIVLFNAWHGTPDFGGFYQGSFQSMSKEQLDKTFKFVDDILDRHGEDERIYAWDLCNEPDLRVSLDLYYSWLKQLHDRIKSRKEKTVLTISNCAGLRAVKKYEPLSDILGPHPYFTYRQPDDYHQNPQDYDDKVVGYKSNLDSYVKFANEVNKPIIATEIGWGDLIDAGRIEKLRVELSSVNERKIGWMIHALCHSPVADLHRPEYGPVASVGYMGCIEPDGSLRPHHEIIRDFLKQ